ncbi:hypothetical protein B0H13DRAFT_1921761 [Mycena leptocephala]|nr:hypothetical protein B0H13DRAFT_1921761 [Mycena leptocephala]
MERIEGMERNTNSTDTESSSERACCNIGTIRNESPVFAGEEAGRARDGNIMVGVLLVRLAAGDPEAGSSGVKSLDIGLSYQCPTTTLVPAIPLPALQPGTYNAFLYAYILLCGHFCVQNLNPDAEASQPKFKDPARAILLLEFHGSTAKTKIGSPPKSRGCGAALCHPSEGLIAELQVLRFRTRYVDRRYYNSTSISIDFILYDSANAAQGIANSGILLQVGLCASMTRHGTSGLFGLRLTLTIKGPDPLVHWSDLGGAQELKKPPMFWRFRGIRNSTHVPPANEQWRTMLLRWSISSTICMYLGCSDAGYETVPGKLDELHTYGIA